MASSLKDTARLYQKALRGVGRIRALFSLLESNEYNPAKLQLVSPSVTAQRFYDGEKSAHYNTLYLGNFQLFGGQQSATVTLEIPTGAVGNASLYASTRIETVTIQANDANQAPFCFVRAYVEPGPEGQAANQCTFLGFKVPVLTCQPLGAG
jgi:hypothetical protein